MPRLIDWISRLFRPTRPIRVARTRLSLQQLECRLAPAVGVGSGLTANYFSDTNLTNLAATRTDAGVNFDWASSPAAGVPADGFSARWTGKVQANDTGNVTFSAVADESVRLWVGGSLLFDGWSNTAQREFSGTASLKAGEWYDVKLEYADRSGPAKVQLLWSGPSTPKQVVPAAQLYGAGGWLDADLGTPAAGGATTAGDVWTVRGSASADHFTYRSLSGDGVVSARADTLGSGVALRAGTAAGNAFASVTLTAAGAVFTARGADGGAVTAATLAGVPAGSFLKVVRDGTLVSGYVSDTGADGSWRLVGSAAVTLADTALAGMVSGTTATFRGVSVTPTVPLGANLDAINDWSQANAFVDIFKQAREFKSLATGAAAKTDADGWATEDFETFVQSGFLNTGSVYNGTYKLSFTGKADVSLSITPGVVRNLVYNAATNTTTADVVLNASDTDGGWYLVLQFRNTGGTVKNIKLIRPGYAADTTQTFTNEFLAQVKSFGTLRFMDWLQTNNNPVVNWSDRAKVTDARQSTAKGVAWEYVVRLANETGKDAWVNIPAGATDDYVRQLAAFLKANLNPDRAVYLEWSNEVWNGMFSQTTANRNAAIAEVKAGGSNLAFAGETEAVNSWDWAFRRIARRITEISTIFQSVWGADALNSRVRPVLASQVAVPYVLRTQLEFIDKTYGDPRNYLHAVAGAPYFYTHDENDPSLTADQILARLTAGIAENAAFLNEYTHLAAYYGLANVSYEGGPDTFGGNNIAAKKAASLDPRMRDVVTAYLNDWYARGGGLFNWFVAGPTNYDTAYGTWGLTNSLLNLNSPKAQGVELVRTSPQAPVSIGAAVTGEVLARDYVGSTLPATDAYPRYLKAGDSRDYLIRTPQAGNYDLAVRYAAVAPGGKVEVWVNDKLVQTVSLPVTGSTSDALWAPNAFADAAAVSVRLDEGLNVVRLRMVTEGPTLYSLKFLAPGTTGGTTGGGTGGTTTPPANTAPTVTASAASAAVTGTTVGLTAVGTDDGGAANLTWAWSAVGTPPAGVTFSANAAATTATFSKSGTYTLRATARDAQGLTGYADVTVTVTVPAPAAPAVVDYSAGFTAAGLQRNGSAALSGTALRLAGGTSQAGSAYSTTKVDVTSFTSTFRFRMSSLDGSPWSLGDGVTFTLQNSGLTALGTKGSGLGYEGITKSVAIKFDMTDTAGEGVNSTGLFTAGALPSKPSITLDGTGLDLHSGGVFRADMTSDGTALTVTLTDEATGKKASQRYVIDLAAALGGTTAYAGFTAGTGALAGNLDVLDWSVRAAAATTPANAAPTVTTTPAVTATGTTVGLTAVGSDDGGAANLTYTWSVVGTPPAPVTFTPNGVNSPSTTATFTRAGTYVVRVTAFDAQGLAASADVTVTVAQTLTTLVVRPGSATMTAGGTQQFTATAGDQFGQSMAVPALTWTATAGTVTAAGLYTAPATATTATVTASAGTVRAGASVTVTAVTGGTTAVNYGTGFTTTGLQTNGSAALSGSRLRLAGGTNQAGSAFTTSKVSVTGFTSSFRFQMSSKDGNPWSLGDGLTFTLQNSGTTALGSKGSGLGYEGITKSVALKFDAVNSAGEGANSTGLYTGGTAPTTSATGLDGTGIDLHSGHVFRVDMAYDGTTLTVTITDESTGAKATQKYVIDLAAVLGGTTAYAGFSAGTGALAGNLDVLDWTYKTA